MSVLTLTRQPFGDQALLTTNTTAQYPTSGQQTLGITFDPVNGATYLGNIASEDFAVTSGIQFFHPNADGVYQVEARLALPASADSSGIQLILYTQAVGGSQSFNIASSSALPTGGIAQVNGYFNASRYSGTALGLIATGNFPAGWSWPAPSAFYLFLNRITAT